MESEIPTFILAKARLEDAVYFESQMRLLTEHQN